MGAVHGLADRELRRCAGGRDGLRHTLSDRGVSQGPQDRHEGEELQLERGNRLFAAIAVMSVVALRLLDLRELGRAYPEAPATCTGLDELELEVLRLAVERELTTVADVLLALGRLGGHMNRRRDGMPGWITLWRGMKVLRLLVRGAKLERARINAHVHY